MLLPSSACRFVPVEKFGQEKCQETTRGLCSSQLRCEGLSTPWTPDPFPDQLPLDPGLTATARTDGHAHTRHRTQSRCRFRLQRNHTHVPPPVSKMIPPRISTPTSHPLGMTWGDSGGAATE